MLPNLIIIVGPTAVGKTDVGIELAKLINGEVISGDSMQVYRMMDIGTAKPTPAELQNIVHHMIDIIDPDTEFTVAMFQVLVEKLVQKINEKGKVPLLVGGTGLYVRSITERHSFTNFAVDWDYRQQLETLAEINGQQWLHDRLREVDPVAAARIHSNDVRRVIRALEVYHHTGKTISSFQQEDQIANNSPKYNLFMYGLTLNREKLYKRINLRVEAMMERGLVQEVQSLLDKGYNAKHISMKGLGYKEIVGYLQGEYPLQDAVSLLQQNTRRFAKRQLTWFRRDQRIRWIDVENYDSSAEIAKEILAQVAGKLTTM